MPNKLNAVRKGIMANEMTHRAKQTGSRVLSTKQQKLKAMEFIRGSIDVA